MLDLLAPLGIRPESPQDRMFLEQLYCESREDLYALATQPEIFQQLMQMQLTIHLQGLQQRYPQSQSWLITRNGQSIGRIVTDMGQNDLRLVDLAISVTARSQGIAQQILRAMQNFADHHHLSISLSVMCSNHRAVDLYKKCGFKQISEDSLFLQMCWLAPLA
ncbi:GNAT family N-acetyltransferase [Undibacterium seohonense]|uniref:GNAT family N-acetyltransferase n=1 Tax=Undibacterium seohonense TaxID=1344950 RepID=A0ABR6X3M2_9BURK|nr:GNAT family N-acetyltransferase [Undibacterium seohonense]